MEGIPTLAVTRVTPDVAACAAAFRARVQSVHRVAAYLETDSPAELLVVALDAAGGQPGGILVTGVHDIRDLGMRAGMRVVTRDGRISIVDAGIVLDVTAAAIWSARLAADAPIVSTDTLETRLVATLAAARRVAGGGGFAPLLWPADGAADPFVRAALPHVAAIRRALDGIDERALRDAAVALIGLGVGLTPSGDDLLVGLMAGLTATSHPLAPALARALGSAGDGRTTSVGAAALRHASAGEFAERIHDVVAAIASPLGPDVDDAVRRLMAYGATSGIDTLAGLVIAVDAAIARSSCEAAA